MELYKHFKGDVYCVIGDAKHTETKETLVIYFRKGEPQTLFARPISMFNDEVSDGVPRFAYVGDTDEDA